MPVIYLSFCSGVSFELFIKYTSDFERPISNKPENDIKNDVIDT